MYERTLSSRTVYDGRVVRLEVHEVELEDGRRSIREIIRHAPAVAALVRLTDGRFLLVRQYRKAADTHLVELCAGLREPGEPPEAAMCRELREETGCEASRLEHLGRVFVSPGYTDEYIDLFFAECLPPTHAASLDADEAVSLVALTRTELESQLREGSIVDGKALAAYGLARLRGILE